MLWSHVWMDVRITFLHGNLASSRPCAQSGLVNVLDGCHFLPRKCQTQYELVSITSVSLVRKCKLHTGRPKPKSNPPTVHCEASNTHKDNTFSLMEPVATVYLCNMGIPQHKYPPTPSDFHLHRHCSSAYLLPLT